MKLVFREEQCPRCRGQVRLDQDQWGYYWACVRCGQYYEVNQAEVQPAPPPVQERVAV